MAFRAASEHVLGVHALALADRRRRERVVRQAIDLSRQRVGRLEDRLDRRRLEQR